MGGGMKKIKKQSTVNKVQLINNNNGGDRDLALAMFSV